MSVICPACGKKVSSMGGIVQTTCLFCGADLSDARPATSDDKVAAATPAPPTTPEAHSSTDTQHNTTPPVPGAPV